MKQCIKCKQFKSAKEFRKRSSEKDGLNRYCKVCHKAQRGDDEQRRRADLQTKLFHYLLEHPCVDCGENDILVLEFDHVDGVKDREISSMINRRGWQSILKEISKCEVRCANCHKRRHAKASLTRKFLFVQELTGDGEISRHTGYEKTPFPFFS